MIEGPIRPGAGVNIEQVQLHPIREQIKAGTHMTDEAARADVVWALANASTLSGDDTLSILSHPANKGFRNAYTSIIMEAVWPDYERMTESGLWELNFKGAESKLDEVPRKKIENQVAWDVARTIASSNQDVSTYLICQTFSEGKVPVISGNPKKDTAYFDEFRDQTDLITKHVGNFYKTVPNELDSPTKFTASGLLVLKTHIFGMPNLLDGVAESQGLSLRPDQHYKGLETSLRTSSSHYYLPTGPLTIAINSHLIDPRTGELRPEQWTSNYNADAFVVFPLPGIVRSVNEAASKQTLPPQTNCPAFHSRVSDESVMGRSVPLPRLLARTVLRQLGTWYYPKRQTEYEKRFRGTLVSLPEAWQDQAPHFPEGLFVPHRYLPLAAKPRSTTETAPSYLTAREMKIFKGLGKESGNTKSFSSFMARAEGVIVAEELGINGPPQAQHQELQRFYRRLLVDIDGAFDADRAAFAGAATSGPEAFLQTLSAVPITRLGESTIFSAREALGIFDKIVGNEKLYPIEARAAIKESAATFMQLGVAEIGRRDSTNLNARETQTVKEMTNGLYAGLLFDIAYGPHINKAGYAQARDRFTAAKLAYQYQDEVLDIVRDAHTGNANLFNAITAEVEGSILSVILNLPTTLIPDEEAIIRDPDSIFAYCQVIQQHAPQAYATIWKRQRRLLEIARLETEVTKAIALPDPPGIA